jgi:hypothetical protein
MFSVFPEEMRLLGLPVLRQYRWSRTVASDIVRFFAFFIFWSSVLTEIINSSASRNVGKAFACTMASATRFSLRVTAVPF